MTNTCNNDYTTPDGADMPLARYIAFHQGYMWVADTVESAVRHPQRVRFSHLQNPEDWATADYFDVDPFDDGDPIVALVPFASYLLIFKRSSVWAVYGSDKDTFSLERIQMGAGVNSAHGVAVSENVAYWFSNDGRLMGFNGQRIVPVMDKLSWWSETGRIKHGGDHDLMWLHGKLWMALETGAGETVDRWLFIWDPQIDALTRYDKSVVEMYNWWRIEQDADPLFLFESTDEMFRFDGSYSFDTVVATGTLTQVDDVTDVEGVDVVPSATEHTGDPCEDAELVFDEGGERMSWRGIHWCSGKKGGV